MTDLSSSPVLILSNIDPFAVGGHRLCFEHPDDPLLCIKVSRTNSTRTGRYNENLLDYEAYQKIEKRDDVEVWRHIPRCHGFVETDLGRGLVMDYIKGGNGEAALTLTQRLAGGFDTSCREALDELEAFLLKYRLPIGDLRPCNLVIRSLPDDGGKERFSVIDGLGDQSFLWSRHFRFFHAYKIQRKIDRLERRIAEHLSGKCVIRPRE